MLGILTSKTFNILMLKKFKSYCIVVFEDGNDGSLFPHHYLQMTVVYGGSVNGLI